MQDSVLSLLHKLQSDVRESQASMQKLRQEWRDLRLSTQVEKQMEEQEEGVDWELRQEIKDCLGQLWSSFAADQSQQVEEAKEVQSSIYVESLWVTEKQVEVMELEQRAARLSKSLG